MALQDRHFHFKPIGKGSILFSELVYIIPLLLLYITHKQKIKKMKNSIISKGKQND